MLRTLIITSVVADFDYYSDVFYNAGTAGEGITVTFGESVEKIPAYLFYVSDSSYSPNIRSVIIGSGVTSIGERAFYNCSGLMSITIPAGVTSIGNRAFYDCSGLMSITIPAGVTSIGSYAFYGCTGLTEINWNAVSVADFNNSSDVFRNAGTAGAGIAVTFGESVEKIPAYLFYVNNSSYRPNIRSVIIGSGVTSIGYEAFYGCDGLMSVTIGSGVTSIGGSAFYGCYKLVEVYNKSSLSITAGSAFNGYIGYYAKNVTKRSWRCPLPLPPMTVPR